MWLSTKYETASHQPPCLQMKCKKCTATTKEHIFHSLFFVVGRLLLCFPEVPRFSPEAPRSASLLQVSESAGGGAGGRGIDGVASAGVDFLLNPSFLPPRGFPPPPVALRLSVDASMTRWPPRRAPSMQRPGRWRDAAANLTARGKEEEVWRRDARERMTSGAGRMHARRGRMVTRSPPTRTGSGKKNWNCSVRVSPVYQGMENNASKFHHGETIHPFLPPISCKNSFHADVSLH